MYYVSFLAYDEEKETLAAQSRHVISCWSLRGDVWTYFTREEVRIVGLLEKATNW